MRERSASVSSEPSALIVRRAPWAPIRARRPRIDLPSAVRPACVRRIRLLNRLATCTKRAAARACRPREFRTTTSCCVTRRPLSPAIRRAEIFGGDGDRPLPLLLDPGRRLLQRALVPDVRELDQHGQVHARDNLYSIAQKG